MPVNSGYSICHLGIKVSGDDIFWDSWYEYKEQIEDVSFTIKIEDAFYLNNMESFECSHSYDLERIIRKEREVALIHSNWTKVEVLPPVVYEDFSALLRVIFYTHAVQHRMIQFHSSLIEHEGCGLMFLGPSGIGKTTQAELWNKYCDALIVNGDIVFVQETEDGFLGWGTPWHGSSPYCENTSVPVKALVVLKQAPENSIRELTGFEKVTAVSNSVFYPRWLENGMELCLETLDHLLSALPVYELSCRPDEEAVKLTESIVFGKE